MTVTALANGQDSKPLPSSARKTAYRPDIDGLRAVAILSVVTFHFFPRALPGGFIGVDVFFVISGFLISGIIFKHLIAGTFSYTNFYARRIKRIFPALIVILVAALVAGWLFLFHDEWKQMTKHVFTGAAFVSNLSLARETVGYFGSVEKPLLHLWSLGVEEQFYLVWPVFLVFACKRPSLTLPCILSVLSISLALNLWYVGKDPSVAFYSPATRFWELALGSVLAYATVFRARAGKPGLSFDLLGRPRVSFALSLAGVSLLVASQLVINENHVFPGIWALLPTTGAFLTIAAGATGWFNRIALSSRPMVFFGLISYPLYLWHWPVLVFARLLNPLGLTSPISAAAVILSVLLSYVTYKFVEGPLRHHRSALAVPALAVSVGTLGLLGIAAYEGAIQPRLQTSPAASIVAAAEADWDYPYLFNFRKSSSFEVGQIGDPGGKAVLFVGDSHIEQYWRRIRALQEGHTGQFPTSLFATYGGCPPLPRVNQISPGYACDKFFDFAMERANDPQVGTVVFGAHWQAYFGYQTDGDRLSSIYRTGHNPHQRTPGIELASVVLDDFGACIRALRARGKKVFVVLSNPVSILYDPRKMASRITGTIVSQDLDRKTLDTSRPIVDLLKIAAERSGAIVIDPIQYFCGEIHCRTTSKESVPLYKDAGHLRSSYASRMATFLDQVYQQ